MNINTDTSTITVSVSRVLNAITFILVSVLVPVILWQTQTLFAISIHIAQIDTQLKYLEQKIEQKIK